MRVRLFTLLCAVLAAGSSGLSPSAAYAGSLGAAQLKAIQAATFEVVVAKPVDDPLTYENPLPLELMPFEERNDKYFPIGTAFAIGEDRYATAAHVIEVAVGYPHGVPALRDASGRVFPLARMVKYSTDRDFAVFSLTERPKAKPLPVNRKQEVNTTVYAVGNALSQGVVIRDGLYTSATPETIDGRWNWLRFSAAASPGSSGGPLLDERGRVIGLVIAASPNENLNYALPIGQLLDAPEGRGNIGGRQPYGVPVMPMSITVDIDEQFALPASYAEFDRQVQGIVRTQAGKWREQFVQTHGDNIFPKGEAAERLLRTTYFTVKPRLVQMGKDRQWDAVSYKEDAEVSLGRNGQVSSGSMAGAGIVRLAKPDDVALADLYRDSRVFMDLLLKGVPLNRQVGSEQVRITSLGVASTDALHVDSYGRKWQVRTWPLWFADFVLVSYALPMPYGYVVLNNLVPARSVEISKDNLSFLANLLYVSYVAPLPDWRAYLAEKALHPAIFGSLEIDFEYEKYLRYRSPRLEVAIDPAEFSVSERSVLALQFSYFRADDKVVWDAAGVTLVEDRDQGTLISVLRRVAPAASADQDDQDDWRRHKDRQPPYRGGPYPSDGKMAMSALVPIAAERNLAAGIEPTVLYQVDFVTSFSASADDVRNSHRAIMKGIKVLE